MIIHSTLHLDGDELVLHSDQGWHYQMKQYRQALKGQAIIQSISRKGNQTILLFQSKIFPSTFSSSLITLFTYILNQFNDPALNLINQIL